MPIYALAVRPADHDDETVLTTSPRIIGESS